MEALWNTMISYLMTSLPTKGFEPGSMEYKFPLTNESLRNIILHSFDSFNNGYIFIMMQIALCIYCPTLALAIIYQQYDLEQEEQQPQPQQQLTQNICQSQTDHKQQFVIRQLLQLIQSIFQTQQCQIKYQMQEMQQQQLKQIKISIQYNNENGGINKKITIVIQISNAELDEERQVYVIEVIEAGQVQNIIF